MAPTIPAGSKVTVDPGAYATAPPQPGDIVVFKRPPAENCGGEPVQYLVKRIIALPGQTVSAHAGKVVITGRVLQEPWLPRTTPRRIDTHMTAHVLLPAGEYFTMGDFRMDSCDSRDWGPVPATLIVGKVVRIRPSYLATSAAATPSP
jgi:signal peptidase I